MITSFEVGSVFRIVDQSSPALQAILRGAKALDKTTASIQKNLSAIGSVKLAAAAGEIKAISTETALLDKGLSSSARAMGRLTRASGGLTSATALIATVTSATQTLALQWQNVAAQAATATAAMRSAGRMRLPPPGGVPPALPGAGGTGRGGRHGPRQGWHLGRFGVGVPVLGGHVHASTPSSGTGVAVGAGLWSVYEMMEQAKEPMHQRAMMQLLGIDDPTIGRMSREAREIAIRVPGSGYAKNMQNMGELYSIVGAEGAMEIAPKLAEIDRVQSIVGGKGKDQGSAYTLTRATELMGKLTDPLTHKVDIKAFSNIIDNMSKMSIASHGKVTPEEWLNYAKQAGPAAGNLSIEGLYTTAAVIQAMGGNRAGTAATAVQRQFAGGVMTASKAAELTNIGILKPGDYEVGKGGHVKVKNDAAKAFVDKLMQDPLGAVTQELIPALESHGYTTNEQITKELYRILGTAPEQREIYEIIRGREQIKQERERAMHAQGPGASITTLNNGDAEAVTGAFTTAFKDLLGAVGGPLMKAAIPGLVALTNLFNNLSAIASDHPRLTGVIASVGAGAVGGAATGLGVGWLGGPVGAGGSAAIGAGIGAGYGVWNALPDWAKNAVATGVRIANPSAGIAMDLGGYLFGGAEKKATQDDKQSLNVTPPTQKIDIAPGKVVLSVDGRTIGEAAVAWMVTQGNGPTQGSPYPDTTRGGSTFDFAMVN